MRTGPEAALFARYTARLRPPLALTEIPDGGGDGMLARRRECSAILAAIPITGFVVALDPGGHAPDSPGLAALLEAWRGSGRVPCFLIGGAEGLDAAVMARADAVLSLGPLTWPHLLARVMFAEQLYRAQAIATNHPYHRAGRP